MRSQAWLGTRRENCLIAAPETRSPARQAENGWELVEMAAVQSFDRRMLMCSGDSTLPSEARTALVTICPKCSGGFNFNVRRRDKCSGGLGNQVEERCECPAARDNGLEGRRKCPAARDNEVEGRRKCPGSRDNDIARLRKCAGTRNSGVAGLRLCADTRDLHCHRRTHEGMARFLEFERTEIRPADPEVRRPFCRTPGVEGRQSGRRLPPRVFVYRVTTRVVVAVRPSACARQK